MRPSLPAIQPFIAHRWSLHQVWRIKSSHVISAFTYVSGRQWRSSYFTDRRVDQQNIFEAPPGRRRGRWSFWLCRLWSSVWGWFTIECIVPPGIPTSVRPSSANKPISRGRATAASGLQPPAKYTSKLAKNATAKSIWLCFVQSRFISNELLLMRQFQHYVITNVARVRGGQAYVI